MKKAVLFPLLLLLGFLLPACEKEVVGIKLPESDAKLVVHCFISPQDEYITAYVSRSRGVFVSGNPADTLVQDATVTLSDGVRTIRLPYDESHKAYVYRVWTQGDDSLKIKPENSYALRVTTPRGEAATAACTVPAALNVPITLSPDSVWDAYYQQYYYRIRMSWPDPTGQGNLYRISCWTEVKISTTTTVTSPADWEAEENISDEGQDGQQLVSPRGNWRRFGSETSLRTSIHARLLHTDPHYYRYHRAVRRAKRNQANPFAEPVLVYSNITGGLGVFGAYTETTTSVRIK